MSDQTILWLVFATVVAGFLIADLGFFNRTAHKVSLKSALWQSAFWIAVSLAYAGLINYMLGRDPAVEFLSAYVTEKLLSVDNLFVILLLFSFFKLDEIYHHRVLFWGILGAIVFRATFILAGSYVITQFNWVLYIFGAILVYTGIKLFFDKKEEHINFHDNKIFKLAKRYLPFTDEPHNGKFFLRHKGKLFFTILFMILLLVESTDILFAIDSIPAAFAITQSAFLVFTSNIFAVMGLRALFFVIEGVVHRFHHLQKALSFILVFIGGKMLLGIFDIHISSLASFATIMIVLGMSLVLSLLFPKKI